MRSRKLIVLLVLAIMLASACSNSGGNSKSTSNNGNPSDEPQGTAAGTSQTEGTRWDPFGKFEEPVVLNIAKSINTNAFTLPNGDTVEKNKILDFLAEKTNVEVKYAWHVETPDAYDQKLGVSIASRELPDAFLVNESQLKTLVKADLIADLTETYNKALDQRFRDFYDSFGDRVLKRVTFDEKIMAIPNTSLAGEHNLLWIRQDWLDQLGLQPPQTVDELSAIAKAFIEKDPDANDKKDTYGLIGYPWSPTYGFDSILGAFNAYQGKWLRDDSGNLVYSSTLPEMKVALGKLKEMYQEGIIDPEFAVRKEPRELVSANKAGIVFGAWSFPYYFINDSIKNDPKAEWKAYSLPLDAEGKYNVTDQNPTNSFLVVRKGYEHPEAIAKLLNWTAGTEEAKGIYPEVQLDSIWDYWPIKLVVDWEDAAYRWYELLKQAIDEKNPELLKNDYSDNSGWYNNYITNLDNPKKDLNAYLDVLARLEGVAQQGDSNLNITRNAFFGQTPTMERKGAILFKLEQETFLKIILGREPIEKFDSFVAEWKKLGGDEIAQEIEQEIGQ